MILGDTCTRACRFCAVTTGNPKGLIDQDEPDKVARAVHEAGLRYVVLTSVDRDDLDDGGACLYADTIHAIREANDAVRIETLIPDYLDDRLDALLDARPDVVGHNIEVVRRLTPLVRDHRSSYDGSLATLLQSREKAPNVPCKSSLMLGIGETDDEIVQALRDLHDAGVSLLTLGQYLQPTKRHYPVDRYVTPEAFDAWAGRARAIGFQCVVSGPLVRSSYRAAEMYREGRTDLSG